MLELTDSVRFRKFFTESGNHEKEWHAREIKRESTRTNKRMTARKTRNEALSLMNVHYHAQHWRGRKKESVEEEKER